MVVNSSVGDYNCADIIKSSLNVFSSRATCRSASIVIPAVI